jgi:prefoldin subunit 5
MSIQKFKEKLTQDLLVLDRKIAEVQGQLSELLAAREESAADLEALNNVKPDATGV